LEKVLRPIIVYLFLIIGLRLSGKRELRNSIRSIWFVLLTLSNTVQNAIIGEDNSVTGGIVGAVSLLVVNYLWCGFCTITRSWSSWWRARRMCLIEDGKIHLGHLKKGLITTEMLASAQRKQGFDSLSEVQKCVLGPAGRCASSERNPGPRI